MSTDLKPSRYTQVPRDLLAAPMSALDKAVWVLLTSYTRPGQPIAWPGRAKLMVQLGRPDHRGDAVTRATSRLADADWLGVYRRHFGGKTRNTYEPLRRVTKGDGRDFVRVDAAVLERLEEGRLSPTELVAFTCWLDACRGTGWTRNTLATHAQTYGGSAPTARDVRTRLVALSLLEIEQVPGKATVTAGAGCLPVGSRESASLGSRESASSPVAKVRHHRSRKCVITGRESASSPVVKVRHEVLREEALTDEAPTDDVAGFPVETSPRSYLPDARDEKRGEISGPTPNDEEPGQASEGPSALVLANLAGGLETAQAEAVRRMAHQAVELCADKMAPRQRDRMAHRRERSLAAALELVHAGWLPQDIGRQVDPDWAKVRDPDSTLAWRLAELLSDPVPTHHKAWTRPDAQGRAVAPEQCPHGDPNGAQACALCKQGAEPHATEVASDKPSAETEMPPGFRDWQKKGRAS